MVAALEHVSSCRPSLHSAFTLSSFAWLRGRPTQPKSCALKRKQTMQILQRENGAGEWGEQEKRKSSVTLQSPHLLMIWHGEPSRISISLNKVLAPPLLSCSGSRQHLSELSGAHANSAKLTTIWLHRLTCTFFQAPKYRSKLSKLTGVELTSF